MSTGNTLQIGDEIVAYTGISQEPPYGFTGCTRGQWGTKRVGPRPRRDGSSIWSRPTAAYIPDENSTLVDEVADCIAKAFNTCGFDMIYLDGSEGMRTAHAVATMKRAIFTQAPGTRAGRVQFRLVGRVAVPLARRGLGSSGVRLQPVHRLALRGTCALQRQTSCCPGTWAGGSSPDPRTTTPACSRRTWSTSAASASAGTGRCRCRASPPARTPPNARQNEYLDDAGPLRTAAAGSALQRERQSQAAHAERAVPLGPGRPGQLAAPAYRLPRAQGDLARRRHRSTGRSRTGTRRSLRSCASRRSMRASPTMRPRACS